MNAFFWSSGHLGWGVFALVVFTGLWLLTGDLVWRVKTSRFSRLAIGVAAGWLVGAAFIVLGYAFFG